MSPFDQFWQTVPRKVGKGHARKAYDRAVKRLEPSRPNPHQFLRERMEAFALTRQAQGKYCPHPSTWLNGERYDDEIEQPIGPGQRYCETSGQTDSCRVGF